jgi:hypothetical protein
MAGRAPQCGRRCRRRQLRPVLEPASQGGGGLGRASRPVSTGSTAPNRAAEVVVLRPPDVGGRDPPSAPLPAFWPAAEGVSITASTPGGRRVAPVAGGRPRGRRVRCHTGSTPATAAMAPRFSSQLGQRPGASGTAGHRRRGRRASPRNPLGCSGAEPASPLGACRPGPSGALTVSWACSGAPSTSGTVERRPEADVQGGRRWIGRTSPIGGESHGMHGIGAPPSWLGPRRVGMSLGRARRQTGASRSRRDGAGLGAQRIGPATARSRFAGGRP